MRHFRWISALELDRWADTNDARSRLPEVIRRLVHATADRSDLTHVDFSAGEETQRPGYDGVTSCTHGNAWVPEGICYWEMGVDGDVKRKLDGDYAKRVRTCGDGDFTQAAYRAVTPRDYQKKTSWAEDKERNGHWGSVRVYDSSDLEQWLDSAAGVALWLARRVSRAPIGVLDLSTHWENLQASLLRPLPPEILLIGREAALQRFADWHRVGPQILSVASHSPQETIDVFSAWVESLPPDEAAVISSRAIIVESADAWRDLADSPQKLILVVGANFPIDESLLSETIRKGHHVLLPLTKSANRRGDEVKLGRINRAEFEKKLIECGMSEQDAHSHAQHSDGFFTLFRRRFSSVPLVTVPEWGRNLDAQFLVPLLLAGSWKDQNSADQAIIVQLTEAGYDNAQGLGNRWRSRPDAPLRWINGVWEFVSPLDAWTFLGPALTPQRLEAFEKCAIDILGEDDPRLELPIDDRWKASLHQKQFSHSSEIRKGVAQTLALLGTRQDGGEIVDVVFLQTRVNRVVRRLFPANGSWKRWASLGSLLPLLAEAAPEVVLDAIESGLRGDVPELPKLFSEERSGMTGRAEHTGLLWALERLAWSDIYVTRVSIALAKLSEYDPGGQWGNRPSGSLLKIFFSWMPHTTATLEQRVDLLRLLLRRHPKAAWKLLQALLPQSHESMMVDETPEWRFWAEGWNRIVSGQEYENTIREYLSLAQSAAEELASRWPDIINKFTSFSFQTLERFLESLQTRAGDHELGFATRSEIWSALRELAQRHRYFSDAEWRLPESLLVKLEQVRDAFTPSDAVKTATPLFQNGFGMVGNQKLPYEQQEQIRAEQRAEAVRAVYKEKGVNGIRQLAEAAQDPSSVGITVAISLGVELDGLVLPTLLCSDEPSIRFMSTAYAAARIFREGIAWVKEMPLSEWDSKQAGAFLAQMSFEPSTWEFVSSLGTEVELLYWGQTKGYGRNLSSENVGQAVRKLLDVGRTASALELMVLTSNEEGALPPSQLLGFVEDTLKSPSKESRKLDPYNLQSALRTLQDTEGIDEPRLARLEWQLLPILDRHTLLPITLQKVLSRQPAFFIEVLSKLYARKNRNASEPKPDASNDAASIYQLLRDWSRVPGTLDNGTVDVEGLRAWMTETRKRASEVDRLDVADLTVGEVFARGPGEADGSWPCIAVREALEEFDSPKLETGFSVGISNLRGAHFRGLEEGGAQERELAKRYEKHALSSRGRWARTEAVLLRVAAEYREEARREDSEATIE